jgi:hypothetical protein
VEVGYVTDVSEEHTEVNFKSMFLRNVGKTVDFHTEPAPKNRINIWPINVKS